MPTPTDRIAAIFESTYGLDWYGASILARAEAQSVNDAKAAAVVAYVIANYAEIREVENGIAVPSGSVVGVQYLVTDDGCSCPARVANCRHRRAVALWRRTLSASTTSTALPRESSVPSEFPSGDAVFVARRRAA